MHFTSLLALALSLGTSQAALQGFNYGSTNGDGSSRTQSQFQELFKTAKGLVGTEGFNSARLYTMIQGGTTNDPISAIPAAIASDTTLLLGLWTSGGNTDNELAALKSAISQYGDQFAKLVVGISVGSEDLYRNSPTGEKSNAGPGVQPDELVDYINQVRSLIKGTGLSGAPIGHVDTWTSWVNSSNSAVNDAVDWLGFDGYPYFQNTMANSIDDGLSLFNDAVAKTKSAAGGKDVWITETGWPVSGSTENQGVASIANAKQYWDQVGCPLFGKVNTYWYTLQDADASATPNPSFGIVGTTLSTKPLFDLTCPKHSASSSAGSSTGSSSGSSSTSASSSSGNGSSSGSTTSTGSSSGSSSSASGGKSSSGGKGSSSAGATSTKASGSGSASGSPSPTSTPNAATRASGSAFGMIIAGIALAMLA
ncbi:hypothetical protein N7474_007347 [Penicillium riverlandense]|uniref:uncharacterized protein n=1 Tax=Penicillium riverlandense TaxID=1903569 RepID=UPI00254929D2|nr:uncharacterized protein N7474_007347 [Penicillium riverlandense]KAJ5815570.1 hypothetical protein N7474_007347 [Penicillium riverlandense]